MTLAPNLVAAVFIFSTFTQQSPPSGSETHTWTGKLVDATRTNCGPEVERSVPTGVCPVSMRTSSFALILSDGKTVKFDEGGNTKAVDALRKSRKGSKVIFDYWKSGKMSKEVKARVTGTLTSDTLNVDSVKVD